MLIRVCVCARKTYSAREAKWPSERMNKDEDIQKYIKKNEKCEPKTTQNVPCYLFTYYQLVLITYRLRWPFSILFSSSLICYLFSFNFTLSIVFSCQSETPKSNTLSLTNTHTCGMHKHTFFGRKKKTQRKRKSERWKGGRGDCCGRAKAKPNYDQNQTYAFTRQARNKITWRALYNKNQKTTSTTKAAPAKAPAQRTRNKMRYRINYSRWYMKPKGVLLIW